MNRELLRLKLLSLLRKSPWIYQRLKHLKDQLRGRTFSLKTRPQTPMTKERLERISKRMLEKFLASGARLRLPTSESPEVSIVLVLYNRAELTFRCLRSLCQIEEPSFEVIVIDNASSDRTEELFKRIDGVRYIRNQENLHFLRGSNQGAKLARGENLLFLNNDTEVGRDSLRFALETVKKGAGAVGGRLILPGGELQEAGSIVWRDGTCLGYGRGDHPERAPYMFARPVDYVSGAFLLTPRALFEKLEGFYDGFAPAYYEETDYCLRLWKNGSSVVFDPRIAIRHFEFASSSSPESALELQRKRRELLLERHRDLLAEHQLPSSAAVLSARTHSRQLRVLFLDERLPHIDTGAGYPRANAMVRAAADLGYFVSTYPVIFVEPEETWEKVYRDIPRTVEVLAFEGFGFSGLKRFLDERKDFYDCIFISRPTVMELIQPLLAEHPDLFGETKVVYDAEALFSLREKAFRALSGKPMTDDEFRKELGRELSLCRCADLVTTVSPGERSVFEEAGFQNTEIIGHSVSVHPPERSFDDRSGILFVGAIHDDVGPNGDSLWWFIREVLPILRARGFREEFFVVGTNHSVRLKNLKLPGVRMVGPVPVLRDWFERSRVFIAPTRFAAGIPLKVIEAASHGVPAVVKPLLAKQLGWRDRSGLLVAESPEELADSIIELYKNRTLWQEIQATALEHVRREYSEAALRDSIRRIVQTP